MSAARGSGGGFVPDNLRGGCEVADYGLFIGFGTPVRVREVQSVEIFKEAMEYYARLQKDGTIESWEAAILEPHGGDLGGFFLVRGDRQRLCRLRVEPEFVRLTTRANLLTERLGVVGATVGDGVADAIAIFEEAVRELA
jgi:hypothetical protein